MGLFDRFFAPRKPAPPAPPAPTAAPQASSARGTVEPDPAAQNGSSVENPNGEARVAAAQRTPTSSAKQRLAEARERLDAKDSAAALAIYEELLADDSDGAGGRGARADVLVTISGDLGSTGHLREITEIVGPRYDAQKHGPATGLNLLQAYIALRNIDAAQHILDILFGLKRPEIEERLHGFSNAIAELMAQGQFASDGPVSPSIGPEGSAAASGADNPAAAAPPPQVSLVTISKPIWSYGLEAALGERFPAREGAKNVRRVAFAQLALPGLETIGTLVTQPEEEMGRLSRAIPLWLAETFSYSPLYAPVAAVGIQAAPGTPGHYALFAHEWTTDNLRQLVESAGGEVGGAGGLDYIFTGSLQQKSGDYTLTLRVWEVRKFRERKKIVLRWTPATADAELAKLHQYLRQFMEWREAEEVGVGGAGEDGASAISPLPPLPYAAPEQPTRWLDTLGTSLTLFLAGKNVLLRELVPPLDALLRDAAAHATSAIESNDSATSQQPAPTATALAALTLLARARDLGAADPATIEELAQALRQLHSSDSPRPPLLTQALTTLGL